MTAIEFYKFINDNVIEWHWALYQEKEKDVIFFVPYRDITDFYDLFDGNYLTDNRIECTMCDGYFAFWAKELLEWYDIELEEIFDKKNNTIQPYN